MIKISLLILLTGWLTAYQPAEYNSRFDLQTPGISASQTDMPGSDAASHRESIPFLPLTLAKTGHESIPEVEPGLDHQLIKPAVNALLNYDADYLSYSEQSENFDPFLKLLFPFHTYL